MMKSLLGSFCGLLAASSALANANLVGFEHDRVPEQFIVRMKDGSLPSRSFFRQAGVTPVHAFTSSPSYLVQVTEGQEWSALEALRNNPEVAFIQANRKIQLFKAPNDSDYSGQYHHKNIASVAAWDITTGDKKVLVGVIDTGIDYNHPDIAPNVWINPGESGVDAQGRDKTSNQVDDDGNGYVDDFRGWDFVNKDNDPFDDNGHGTHTAGIIGAKGNNASYVTGVAWDVSLIGLKIFGRSGGGDTAAAVQAIEYANAMGISITNNSWGGEVEAIPGAEEEDVLREAIAAGAEKGYLFVAAAGNSSSNNDKRPQLPATYDLPNIISVAASGGNDRLAFFSCYGASTVHIAAPGSGILSTVPGRRTSKMSGTSMASPVVAGAAALIKAAHPSWDAAQIKARLLETADPIAALEGRLITGGRLNVAKALAD